MSQQEEDHDILLRIDENLKFFMKEFTTHEGKDEKQFDEHNKRIKRLEDATLMLVGGFIVVQALFKVFLK